MKRLIISATIIVVCAVTSPVRAHDAECSQVSPLEATRQMLRATEAKDIDALMTFFSEDAVFAQPFNPRGSDFAYRGRAAIRAGFEGIFDLVEVIDYTDRRFTVSENGRTVFFEAQGDMTLAGSGSDYDNTYVFRVDFDECGRIETLTEYTNSLYLVQTFDFLRDE